MFTASIEGDGLTLRLLTPDDVPALLSFLNLPEVIEPTSSEGWTRDSLQEFTEANGVAAATGEWCRYGIYPAGSTEPVGAIGLFHVDERNERAEIGYELSPDRWGQGLMVRAANALIEWALANGFHRIEATVMLGNRRSERVLEKLGFAREGAMRDYKLVRGEWRDYSLWGRVAGGALQEGGNQVGAH